MEIPVLFSLSLRRKIVAGVNLPRNNLAAIYSPQACIETDGCVSFNLGSQTGECQLTGARAGIAPGLALSKYEGFHYYERLDAQAVLVWVGLV